MVLALVIGATTAMFTLVNVLLRGLPVDDDPMASVRVGRALGTAAAATAGRVLDSLPVRTNGTGPPGDGQSAARLHPPRAPSDRPPAGRL